MQKENFIVGKVKKQTPIVECLLSREYKSIASGRARIKIKAKNIDKQKNRPEMWQNLSQYKKCRVN